jgi:hypothetical protein
MGGVLFGMLEKAYRAGFAHGLTARKIDEPSSRRMDDELRQLAQDFWQMEAAYYRRKQHNSLHGGEL